MLEVGTLERISESQCDDFLFLDDDNDTNLVDGALVPSSSFANVMEDDSMEYSLVGEHDLDNQNKDEKQQEE